MATAKRRHETLDGDLGEEESEGEDDEEPEESPGKRVKLEHHHEGLLTPTPLSHATLDL